MTVFLNNTGVEVYAGAKAKDAVMAYFRSLQLPVPEPFPIIFDQFGNQIEPDGELTDTNQLFIVEPEAIRSYD